MAGIWRNFFITAVGGAGSLKFPKAYCAKNEDDCKPKPKKKCKNPEEACQTELEQCIAKCKKDFIPIKNAVLGYSQQAVDFAKVSSAAVKRNVNYLQKCAPKEEKVGVIVASGIFGMLLGFRRGLIRKVFYGAIGSTITAAILYPCEAKVIASQGYLISRKYVKRAYKQVSSLIQGPQECKKGKAKKPTAEKSNCLPSKKD